jgi:hypothetical protein
MTCGAALLMGEHRIQTVIGSAIVGVGFIVEALEHADFIWNHPKEVCGHCRKASFCRYIGYGTKQ